jgi:hypothetical protein
VEQKFGSALNVNPHFHSLVPDGIFVWNEALSRPVFHSLPAPKPDDIQELAEIIHIRVERLLRKRGFLADDEHEPEDAQEILQMASITGTNVLGRNAGRRPNRHRGASERRYRRRRLQGESGDFDLDASVRVSAKDRAGLRRVCKYLARPPLGNKRLSELDDGTIALTLKSPWTDGTTHLFFEPIELLGRLAALTPEPRSHSIHYSGIFAPAAAWRSQVVPARRAKKRLTKSSIVTRQLWSDLLRKVFAVDVLACECCGGRMTPRAILPGSRVEAVRCSVERREANLDLPYQPRAGPRAA